MNGSASRPLRVALVIAACFATAAHAQEKPGDYPKKPVRIVIGIAPAGTPRGIIRAISAIVSEGMNSPGTVNLLAADGSEPIPPSTPEEFKSRFDGAYAELEKLIKAADIKIN